MSKWQVQIILVLLAAVMVTGTLLSCREKADVMEESDEDGTDVGVLVGEVTRSTLHKYVTAYGTVQPEPPAKGKMPAEAVVTSPVAGVLVDISCLEGRQVSRGETLFRLDSRVAEVEVQRAQAALDFAERNYERQKKLLSVKGTSEKLVLEAEWQKNAAAVELAAARTRLALLRIEAPLSGTLVRLAATLGESVDPGKELAEIVDLDRLVVTAGVPSYEASLLKIGQPVELDHGEFGTGTLVFIGKDIDPKTGTIPVRASIPAGAGLLPGRFLVIRVICDTHQDCLVVPEDSIITYPDGGGALMIVEGDRAVRKAVTIGLRDAGLVEVAAEGLAEGPTIVTEDAYSLPPETKIHMRNP